MTYLDLLHRGSGERNPNRVPDAIREKGPDPDGPLDGPGFDRSGLRHPMMERVRLTLRQQAIRLDHVEHVGMLHGDDDVLEAVPLTDLDVSHCALEEGLRLRIAVLIEQVPLE